MSVLEYYGYDQSDAMSLGDGNNDMEMTLFVGTGVAMGNAVGDLKAVAVGVTDDIDQNGWEKAMKHYGLI